MKGTACEVVVKSLDNSNRFSGVPYSLRIFHVVSRCLGQIKKLVG